MAADVFGGGVPALVANMTEFIPDSDERKIFAEKVMEEYRIGENHVSFRTYGLQSF